MQTETQRLRKLIEADRNKMQVLIGENARLREALRFYAEGNHSAFNDYDLKGKGQKAREALEDK